MKGTTVSVGDKGPGPPAHPRKYTTRAAHTSWACRRMEKGPFPPFVVLISMGSGKWKEEGTEKSNQAPQATWLVPLLSPVLQLCRPCFFPCLSKAPSLLRAFTYAVPRAWETISLPPHLELLLTLSLKCHFRRDAFP